MEKVAGLSLHFLEQVQPLNGFRAVILPGSKNTRYDLDWLKTTGWAQVIADRAAEGGHVLGICGGYQMLGRFVHDPQGCEGNPGSTPGLNLLPVETVLKSPKTTSRTRLCLGGCRGFRI